MMTNSKKETLNAMMLSKYNAQPSPVTSYEWKHTQKDGIYGCWVCAFVTPAPDTKTPPTLYMVHHVISRRDTPVTIIYRSVEKVEGQYEDSPGIE